MVEVLYSVVAGPVAEEDSGWDAGYVTGTGEVTEALGLEVVSPEVVLADKVETGTEALAVSSSQSSSEAVDDEAVADEVTAEVEAVEVMPADEVETGMEVL